MKAIGILGGMGPLATLAFEQILLEMVGAKKDQDYPPVFVINDGTLPDRTDAIMNGSDAPVEGMKASLEKLKQMGAEILCIPCNTVHAYYDQLKPALADTTFVHIVEAVKQELKDKNPTAKKIGVMATVGTKKGKSYESILIPSGYEVIYPDDDNQALVTDAIYGDQGIKAGGVEYPRKQLEQVVEHLKSSGVDVVVLGCTELSIALKKAALPLTDSNHALAKAVLQAARG